MPRAPKKRDQYEPTHEVFPAVVDGHEERIVVAMGGKKLTIYVPVHEGGEVRSVQVIVPRNAFLRFVLNLYRRMNASGTE